MKKKESFTSIIMIITSIVIFSMILLFSVHILFMKLLEYINIYGIKIHSWVSASVFIVSVLLFFILIDYPMMWIEAIMKNKYRVSYKYGKFIMFLLQFLFLFMFICIVDKYIEGVTFSTYLSKIAIACVFYIVYECVNNLDEYIQKKDKEEKG